ncbi:MAG: DUF3576 domain-containing protein [Hyphomonadaceae bacterium]|nr:DUF3576 domain-containing protein [Hyphomonadaceae bacterium]
MTPRGRNVWPAAVIMATLTAVAACSSDGDATPAGSPRAEKSGGFLGFGGDEQPSETDAGIGVNALLWRASLDTISFMPLTLTDSFGGVILTDWYADPRTPGERFKMQVYILDTRLRADGVKVNVFKQVQGAGGWTDAAVNEDTALQIENAILARARELRLATLND